MNKDTNVIFRINSTLKENVTRIAKEHGYTLSELITGSLMDIEHRNMIPIYISKFLPRLRNNSLVTLAEIKAAVEAVVKKYAENNVKKVYLFGSYARGEQNCKSDVDLRFEVTDKFTLVDHANIRLDIKEMLSKEVDLITGDEMELDKFFLENIRKEEICIYEQQR